MKIFKTGTEAQNLSPGAIKHAAEVKSSDFGKWLEQNLSQVNKLQQEADHAARDMITGRNNDLHNTMIAIQKAEVSFKLLMEIRNKLISAYEEVQRMQF